jgi:phosphotriesterase-related protein
MTGTPIMTHANAVARSGVDQVRIFKSEGVDPSKVVIGHCDDADESDYLEALFSEGVYCGFDRFGNPDSPRTTEQRLDLLHKMIMHGYVGQILLSQDTCGYIDRWEDGILAQDNPEWRYSFLVDAILPQLRARGVNESQIEQMTIVNPAAFLQSRG